MKNSIKSQRGAGLIEVMVTVLVLSTSLLALAAMQARSLEYNHNSYMRSQANILAYDILDRIRANKSAIADYNKGVTTFAGGTAPTSPLSAVDIYNWQQSINTALPAGQSGIACDAASFVCKVTITWNEKDAAISNTPASFTFTTQIPQ